MLAFDRLADTSGESELRFRLLYPPLQTKMYVIRENIRYLRLLRNYCRKN